jgi:hypothetical protein
VWASLSFSGCTGCSNRPGKFQAKLIHAIKEKCRAGQPCIIRIKDLTDFSWDKMYWFENTASQEQVEQVLGTKVEPLQESLKIVFMNKGKIVLFENEPYEMERAVPDEVTFYDNSDSRNYQAYGPDAEFTVKINELNHGTSYVLTLVKQPTSSNSVGAFHLAVVSGFRRETATRSTPDKQAGVRSKIIPA